MSKLPKIELLLSESRGNYIPRDFIEMIESQPEWKGITEENKEILLYGPDHDWYWEAWEEVLNNAHITINKRKYTLYQYGDLFAVAYDAMTSKEKIDFFGND